MTEPLKALEADADTSPDGVSVTLATDDGDADLVVPRPGRWKTRANTALRVGDFDVWAELVLSKKDHAAWVELDPTNDDVEAFFKAWQDASGEDPKGSRPSRRSSRSTPKR